MLYPRLRRARTLGEIGTAVTAVLHLLAALVGYALAFGLLALGCSILLGSAAGGALVALLVMALNGFRPPREGARAEGCYDLPPVLVDMFDSAALLISRLSDALRAPYRRAVVVIDTHGALGPVLPLWEVAA